MLDLLDEVNGFQSYPEGMKLLQMKKSVFHADVEKDMISPDAAASSTVDASPSTYFSCTTIVLYYIPGERCLDVLVSAQQQPGS